MYSSKIGRFLQTDPIGYYDSANLYQYCGNNPVNFVDPMGLCEKPIDEKLKEFLDGILPPLPPYPQDPNPEKLPGPTSTPLGEAVGDAVRDAVDFIANGWPENDAFGLAAQALDNFFDWGEEQK